MREELSELLDIAKRAARLAAAVHHRAMEGGDFNAETMRSTYDLVTEINNLLQHSAG